MEQRLQQEAINSSDSTITIPRSLVSKNSTYFGLKVKGLSMIDEGIFDGDIAIIKKTTSAENQSTLSYN